MSTPDSFSTFLPLCAVCLILVSINNNNFVLSCGEFLCFSCAEEFKVNSTLICPSCKKSDVLIKSFDDRLPNHLLNKMV